MILFLNFCYSSVIISIIVSSLKLSVSISLMSEDLMTLISEIQQPKQNRSTKFVLSRDAASTRVLTRVEYSSLDMVLDRVLE